jgi:uncharacterized protein (TIGR02453 family)
MTALLAEVAGELAATYKPVKLGAPKLMRIYRDTRFSKDKSPYKTWIGGGVSLGSDSKPSEGVTGMYAHFGVGEDFVGVGQYVFDDAAIARWRKRVADDKTGAPLQKLVDGLRDGGYAVHGSGAYARVPKPYAEDHSRAELLKMRGLVVGFPAVPKGLIHERGFVDWLVGHAKATAPVAKWLHANCG